MLVGKNKTVIAKRRENQDFPGYWEFPGGKQKNGENIRNTLIREIKEEINVLVSPEDIIFFHKESLFNFEISFFLITQYKKKITAVEKQTLRFVKISCLKKFIMPKMNTSVINKLVKWNCK